MNITHHHSLRFKDTLLHMQFSIHATKDHRRMNTNSTEYNAGLVHHQCSTEEENTSVDGPIKCELLREFQQAFQTEIRHEMVHSGFNDSLHPLAS